MTADSATTSNAASITNISMPDKTDQEQSFDEPNLMKEGNDLVENYRVKSAGTGLELGELRNRLASINGVEGINRYVDTNKYNPGTRELNQLIVTFDSMVSKNNFLLHVPTQMVIKDFNIIPSVVIVNDLQVQNLLLNTPSIVDLMADQLLDLPEYEIEDRDTAETSFFSSEGRIGAWDIQDLGYTGKDVKISVLDTGIDATHPDLMYTSDGSPKIIAQQSFVPGEDYQDYIGHGTHVAGTTAGNGYQIGVAPDAQLLNAKVCSAGGCAYSWMLEAVEWSIMQNADIITMSIGGSTLYGRYPLNDMIDYAWQEGIAITIAAGNDGPGVSTVQTPGIEPRVITVGATDVYDMVTAFSGRGPSVYGNYDPDLSAPGMGIWSTLPGGTYGIYSGTSMATPHVAGAIALMMDAHPRSSNDEIKANLMANAKDMGHETNVQGAGMVDLVNAHDNWSRKTATIFPQLTERDVFYLTPGETFTGVFDFIRGNRGPVPKFYLDHNRVFDVDIHKYALKPWVKGHQFVPFSITAPEDAEVGDVLERTLVAANMPSFFWHHKKGWDYWKMEIVVQIVDPEDDASQGFDASDTFIGATEVPFSNFTGYATDIDFYKVKLTEGMSYTIILDGMKGMSDFDLGVYDKDGVLTCDTCNIGYGGNSPETVGLTAQYTGYYYIRVDPWSILYMDPYTNTDSSGPYELWMFEGSAGGGEEPLGTQFDFLNAMIHGMDEDSDGTFEYLAVDVTVDVTSVGLLDAYAFLTLDKGGPLEKWFFAVAFTEFYEFTETGVQTFTMALDPMLFADQAYTGPVVLYELFMGDPSTFTILYDLFNVHTSETLDSADFGPTHMTYNYVSSQPLDVDADGIGDILEVAISVNIETTYPWYTTFDATLYHPNGYFIYSANQAEIDLSVAGEHLLYFQFFPQDFLSPDGGVVDLELLITYSWDHPLTTITEHYGYYPYILTLGDTISVDPVDYGAGGGGNYIAGITDFGFDADADGTFDYLVIEVSVHISDPAYYSVTFDPWVWSIPGQEVLFDFESDPYNSIQWLDTGDWSLYMTVSGELINSLEVDGPFLFLTIWLDSWEDSPYGLEYTGTPDEYQNFVSGEYSSEEFDTAGVRYLGISGVDYVDLNGDGDAETVELQVDVEVGYAGEFYFFFGMYDYPLGGYLYGAGYGIYWYFDSAGTHTVSLYLDGRDFWNEKYQGYVEIWELDVLKLDTGEFTYFDFQNGIFEVDYEMLPGAAPPGTITAIDDYPVDTNGNGLYEYVAVDITIEVRYPSYFDLYMDVYGGAYFYDYVGFYYTGFYADSPGEYTVTLLIPALDILSNVFDESTSLELWIYMFDDYGLSERVGPVYTDTYDLDMFERPAYMSDISEAGVDDDGNGLYESLRITVTVEVSTPGDYNIDMEAYIGETGDYLGYSYGYLFAPSPGTYMVDLFISGTAIIAQSPVDYTNFELWFYLWGNTGLVDQIMGYYTDYYFVSDFEYSALITDILDYGRDDNGNGLYEAIDVELTVDVNVPGYYYFDMGVMSGVTFNWITSTFQGLYAPAAGVYTVDLLIPGSAIITATGADASNYELMIYLYNENFDMLQNIEGVYTDFYNIADFEYSALITDVTDFGLDENGNGLFEAVDIQLTIDVVIPGIYYFNMDAISEVTYNWIGYDYTQLFADTPGVYTVDLLISGADIRANSGTDYTNFLVFIYMDSDSGPLQSIDGYLTEYYYTSDFETAALITDVIDYGVDNDGNGQYEFINLDVTMEITSPGSYSIHLDMFGNDDLDYSEFVVGYTEYFDLDSGIFTTTIKLPTSLILSRLTDDYTDFLAYLTLSREKNEVDFVDYFTSYYSVDDLELIAAVNSASDYGQDTDSDGLFENLVVEVEVEIFKAGDYALYSPLYGDADTTYDYVGEYQTPFSVSTPGVYAITLTIPAADIQAAGLDPTTNFFYYGVVLDADAYVVTIGGGFYSGYYQLSDFDGS